MSNLKIITGHYGSGKTEFCINYAIKQKKTTEKVAIIDIDIVNPYFRSREKSDMLIKEGIEVLGSSTGHTENADLPALPSKIYSYIEDETFLSIFDVGGDAVGARVLSRYAPKIKQRSYDMYLVLNANRPMTGTALQACVFIDEIESQSQLKINGIINSTHMLRDTSKQDILKGAELSAEVSKLRDLPVIYNIIPKHLSYMTDEGLNDAFVLEDYFMRPEWL